jgi:hypothetical protein
MRIVNVRTDVTGVAVPPVPGYQAQTATVAAGPIAINYQFGYDWNSNSISGPTVYTGWVQSQDLIASTPTADDTAAANGWTVNQCSSGVPQRAGVLRFSEQSPSVFRPRDIASSNPFTPINPDAPPVPKQQNIPGTIWNSESWFYAPLLTSPQRQLRHRRTGGLRNAAAGGHRECPCRVAGLRQHCARHLHERRSRHQQQCEPGLVPGAAGAK